MCMGTSTASHQVFGGWSVAGVALYRGLTVYVQVQCVGLRRSQHTPSPWQQDSKRCTSHRRPLLPKHHTISRYVRIDTGACHRSMVFIAIENRGKISFTPSRWNKAFILPIFVKFALAERQQTDTYIEFHRIGLYLKCDYKLRKFYLPQ
jgi:hypothetical protein